MTLLSGTDAPPVATFPNLSGDAILVIRKEDAQDVRKVIDALSVRGLARYL